MNGYRWAWYFAQPLQGAGHGDGCDADLVEQGIGQRSGTGQDVCSPIQPVGASPLRANPAADALVGLQHHGVPVT